MKRTVAVLLCLLLPALAACQSQPALPANLPTPPPAVSDAPLAGQANAGAVANAPQSNQPASVAISTFQGSIQRQVPGLGMDPQPPMELKAPAPMTDYGGGPDYGDVDFCNMDMSGLDFTNFASTLALCSFNENTKWPTGGLPDGFEPALFLENGKNRGLGVESLHKQGITGKGIGIAMVGEPIVTGHQEIKDNLVDYEEFDTFSKDADPMCTAAASLLVGKTVGMAPDAKLYYFAAAPAKSWDDISHQDWTQDVFDYTSYAEAFNRILDINSQLSDADKIRIVYVPRYWWGFGDPLPPGYMDWLTASEKLKATGVFIVSPSLRGEYSFGTEGLKPNLLEDIDDLSNYTVSFETDFYLQNFNYDAMAWTAQSLFYPTDGMTLAGAGGTDDYRYYGFVYEDIACAYLAGLYAMTCQVNSSVTPESWWQALKDTSATMTLHNTGVNHDKDYNVKYAIVPAKMIAQFQQ